MDTAAPNTTSAAAAAASSSSSLILSVSILGILAISLLLLAYYLFLTRRHHCTGTGTGLLFFFFFCRPTQLHDHDVATRPHHHLLPRRSAGLEEAAIRRIPTFRYHRHGGQGHLLVLTPLSVSSEATNSTAAADECAVCLADFRDGERLRLLPPCLHAFHIDCIDAWLQATATCPLCRAAVSDSGSGHASNHLLHAPLPLPLIDSNSNDGVAADIAIDIPSSAAAEEAAEPPSSETQTAFVQFQFQFQPMRRSLSMDSSTDRRFYLALQRTLQQQKHNSSGGKGDSSSSSSDAAAAAEQRSRRLRRSFFSFSLQSRPSPSAVLPLSREAQLAN